MYTEYLLMNSLNCEVYLVLQSGGEASGTAEAV